MERRKSMNFSIRTVFLFVIIFLFFSSLPWSVSRNSLVLFFGISPVVFRPLSWTSFRDQTCFLPSPPSLPTLLHSASLLRYALLLLPLFLPFSLSSSTPPPLISYFSWTSPMRYSVFRHRYGWLSLLTVSTLIPSWPFPLSSVRSSPSNRQVGSLLLCGLHLLNAQYMLLINQTRK